jgi:hypothetical protein
VVVVAVVVVVVKTGVYIYEGEHGHHTTGPIRSTHNRRQRRDGMPPMQQNTQGHLPHLHELDLLLRPAVHGDGAHEGDVHAEGAVLARTLEADEGPERDARPLRVGRGAIGAHLEWVDPIDRSVDEVGE